MKLFKRSCRECQQDRHQAVGELMAAMRMAGWALSERFRCTSAALNIALSAYSLARMLGGCIGITTATVRHSSASILRRIGGGGFKSDGVERPKYYDPRYKCEMVVLRFDSSAPNPRYADRVGGLGAYLPFAKVICPDGDENIDQPVHASAWRGPICGMGAWPIVARATDSVRF